MEIGSAAHRMQGLHDCMLPKSGERPPQRSVPGTPGLASSDGGLGLGHAPSRATGFVAHSAPSSKAKRVLVEALGPYQRPPHQKPLSLPCCLLSRSRPDRSTKPL